MNSLKPHTSILERDRPLNRRTLRALTLAFRDLSYGILHISSITPSIVFEVGPGATSSLDAAQSDQGSLTRQLLEDVKVLAVEGYVKHALESTGPMPLRDIRTLWIDMTITELSQRRNQILCSGRLPKEVDEYDGLANIAPEVIVVKTGFYEDGRGAFPHSLPPSTLSRLQRITYLISYTDWDLFLQAEYYDASSIRQFGLGRWLEPLSDRIESPLPHHLTKVDIVFWTDSPEASFDAKPDNTYGSEEVSPYRNRRKYRLDDFIGRIAPTCLLDDIQLNFVNTGAFDPKATRAYTEDYEGMEKAFKTKLLLEMGSRRSRDGARPSDIISCMSIPEWLEELEAAGIRARDVLSEEDLRHWM